MLLIKVTDLQSNHNEYCENQTEGQTENDFQVYIECERGEN